MNPALLLLTACLVVPEDNTEINVMFDPEQLRASLDRLILDEPGDGRTWARARDWKASFGDEGVTFIPFFGSDASRNYPIELDLFAARLGSEPIELGPRTRHREGATVVLDRGSLREVYHLADGGVEQTFVLDTLPHAGDLLLEIRVTTDLRVAAQGDGFSFSGPEGEARYGGATAIDADGRRLALHQEWSNGAIRITVPAEFLRVAALPVVVDPILSTFTVSPGPRAQVHVDAAYLAAGEVCQIVVEERQSTLDSDVVSVIYNEGLGLLFPATAVDVTSTSWRAPANAAALHAESFLAAAVTGVGVGATRVHGRTLHALTGARGPQFEIGGLGASDVDVGGKGNGVASAYDFMVVWQEADTFGQDIDIVAQAVDDDSTLTGGRVLIAPDPSRLDRKPRISKSSGPPGSPNADNEYMVVWEREITPTDHNVRGQVLEYTGSMTGHSQFNVYTFSDSLDPDVSSAAWNHQVPTPARFWTVVFERRTGVDYDIFAVIAFDGSADNARSVTAMQDIDLALNHRDPKVANDGLDLLVLYQTERPSGDHSVHITTLNAVYDGPETRTGVAWRRGDLGVFAGGTASTALATYYDGGASFLPFTPKDGFALFSARATPLGTAQAEGILFSHQETPVAGSQFCEATPNSTGLSAWITLRARDGVAAGDNVHLRCYDAPPHQFGIFIVGQSSGFVPAAGGSQGNLCLQGAIGRIGFPGQTLQADANGIFSLVFGTAWVPMPNGVVSTMPGETWYFQTWFRDALGTSNFSNGIEILIL